VHGTGREGGEAVGDVIGDSTASCGGGGSEVVQIAAEKEGVSTSLIDGPFTHWPTVKGCKGLRWGAGAVRVHHGPAITCLF